MWDVGQAVPGCGGVRQLAGFPHRAHRTLDSLRTAIGDLGGQCFCAERNWSSGTISVTSPVRVAVWALNRWIP